MPRPIPRELVVGCVQLDTGSRKIEHPVDSLGRFRWRAPMAAPQVRADQEGGPIGFRGHAAVFNKRTRIGGKRWGFWEEIAPGAFRKSVRENDVRFLMNHDPQFVLARNRAGSLRLSEDDVGLAVDADMAPTTYARDLSLLLERGDVNQMSFAFVPISWEITEAEDGDELIRMTEAELWDVSVVTYPAYEDTDAGLRARGFERMARFYGLDEDARRRFLSDDEDEIDEPLRGERSEDPPPAETTGENSPPAETTGAADTDHSHLRELRFRMLADKMKEM